MKDLLDPETQAAEVARLEDCKLTLGKVGGRALEGYRLHWIPDGKEDPLLLLAAHEEYHVGDPLDRGYAIEKPEEIFDPREAPGSVKGPSKPLLQPVEGWSLRLLDKSGKDVKPWKDDSYISYGYLYDLNGDGILDKAAGGSEAVKDTHVDVFELGTIERTPRVLLRIVYNWRPSKS